MIRSVDPRTGQPFGPEFPDADEAHIDAAVRAAAAGAEPWQALSPEALGERLTVAANALDEDAEALVDIADHETALGRPRLVGEVARTTGQLRAFAELVRTGAHLDVVVSQLPDGAPARDLRRMNVPVGTVAVFAAANFPFAFSVAGGDTASALAAGCPVVVKAHYGHPQTSARVAELLVGSELPVQLLHGGTATGAALVQHPQIAAVGFTGSTAGGRALTDLAAARPVPIPVYAEQGSRNPVVLAPSALRDVDGPARTLSASVANGAGQFCTKPGLIFVPESRATEFAAALARQLSDTADVHLLTAKIREQFADAVDAAEHASGQLGWHGTMADDGFAAAPVVLHTDVETLIDKPALRAELFGPAAVVVAVDRPEQLADAMTALGGNLTGTVHGDPTDGWVSAAIAALRPHVGRLVYGGVPTGVAVDPAMQHGGPYPASNQPGYTSVGTAAIRRFLRPVAYQDFPAELLPPALRHVSPPMSDSKAS